MRRHGLYRSSVFTFELRDDPAQAVSPIPTGSFAALNTHDTPTFAGWWEGRDIEDRIGMGLLTTEEGQQERIQRERLRKALLRFLQERGILKGTTGRASALRACLSYLASSRPRAVVVTLEDLWGELHPQNVPGTTSGERPNWQRRMRFPVEEILTKAEVMRALELVEYHRTHSSCSN
jgi:4-alpha-glucanotransferase